MLEKLSSLLSRIDRFVGPVYRVLFVTSVIIGLITWISFQAIPALTHAYNWVDGKITDIGPIVGSPAYTTRLLISLQIGLAGGLLMLIFEYAKIQRVRLQITDEIRRCTASHIKYYDELFTLLTEEDPVSSDTMEKVSEISRNHLIFLCSRLAEIFGVATGYPCHASIKSFNSSTGMVTTRTRDALMHNHDRSMADDFRHSYPMDANTAFSSILTNPSVDFYVENHLRLVSFFGRYKNANPDWKKSYHATVVAPITTSRSAATITSDTVIGFVCVDSMKGTFQRRYSKAVLSVFVLFINDMMTKLGEIQAA